MQIVVDEQWGQPVSLNRDLPYCAKMLTASVDCIEKKKEQTMEVVVSFLNFSRSLHLDVCCWQMMKKKRMEEMEVSVEESTHSWRGYRCDKKKSSLNQCCCLNFL